MNPKAVSKRQKAPLLTGISILVLAGVLLFGWLQREAIYDWWRLRGYTPAPEIAQMATDATMTDYATHMYYVNRPEFKDRKSFATFCSNGHEETVVLGCYKSGQQGIYLLQVSNAELAGIQQVTAAHEMLHAVYDRFSTEERKRIDKLLQDFYDNQLSDQTIKDTIDGYRKTEPDDLVNEMHSIIGTQVGSLPAELEKHYEKYFDDRSKLVAYYETYRHAFQSRQQQIKQADAQLDSLKQQIDQLEAEVKSEQAELNARRATLERHQANGNAEAYNAGVDGFNALVVRYNANVTRLQNLIAQHNQLVEERNAIAFEERQLVESLSSSGIERQ
ncbi:MAG TPA: hypothetical protein VGE30_02240 [Candidatus Saccharimonadales bacterium]